MNPLAWPDHGPLLHPGRYASGSLQPDSIPALQHDIRRLAAEHIPIYPIGGATALDYGNPPARPGFALHTRALDRVIDYPAADMTITIEAGTSLATLQNILAREHQRFPLDPPQPELATLGAIFATNASGPRRFGLGKPRDLVIGIAFVSAQGKLIHGGGRVVKNVAGYDFPRLLTGSLGTLGIITELTLKVRPTPETSALLLATVDLNNQLAPLLDALNTSATRPVAIEILDHHAARVAFSYELPDPAHALLILGFEGFEDAVAWQLQTARDEIQSHASHIDPISNAQANAAWSHLAQFPARPAPGPLSLHASLLPSQLHAFLRLLQPDLWSWQASAGDGVVHAHALPPSLSLEDARRQVDQLRHALAPLHGHLVLTRCPADWKNSLSVWGPPRPDWTIMNQIKHALDPDDLLNPGRFLVNMNP